MVIQSGSPGNLPQPLDNPFPYSTSICSALAAWGCTSPHSEEELLIYLSPSGGSHDVGGFHGKNATYDPLAHSPKKDTVSKQRQDDEVKGREHAFAHSTL